MKKILILALILLPLSTFAQQKDYVLLEPLPCIQNTGQGETEAECTDGTLINKISTDTYIAYIFNFAIAFAGVAAVIVIMVAGFQYAVSDIVTSKSAARERIKNAIIGLVTVICSYFILELVDPRLVNIDTRLEEIETGSDYVFDYDSLVNTAEDYKIRRDLDAARAEMRPLEKEAKLLRAEAARHREEAARNTDPVKIAELNKKAVIADQKAIELEKRSAVIGSKVAMKAVADLQYVSIGEITGDESQPKEVVDLIEKRKLSISGQADKDIKKMIDMNNPEAAQVLREDKEYYVAKFDQNVMVQKAVVKATAAKDLSADFVISGPGSEITKANLKARGAAETKKAQELLATLKNTPIPSNLTEQYKAELAKEKEDAVKKIEEILKPKTP